MASRLFGESGVAGSLGTRLRVVLLRSEQATRHRLNSNVLAISAARTIEARLMYLVIPMARASQFMCPNFVK